MWDDLCTAAVSNEWVKVQRKEERRAYRSDRTSAVFVHQGLDAVSFLGPLFSHSIVLWHCIALVPTIEQKKPSTSTKKES